MSKNNRNTTGHSKQSHKNNSAKGHSENRHSSKGHSSHYHRGVSTAQSRRLRRNSGKYTFPSSHSNGGRKKKGFNLEIPFLTDHPGRAELLVLSLGIILLVIFAGMIMSKVLHNRNNKGAKSVFDLESGSLTPEIKEDFLTISAYNRPGIKLNEVSKIVIHYVQNPGSTAKENRNYFENLATTHETKASAHFIVGLDGEIIQLIPLNEVAYASNSANSYSISIECCHPDATGQFNEKTYQSVVQLTAWLCDNYSLTSEDVIRHYDVTGKMCPKYFVEHEDAWETFRQDVQELLDKKG